MIAKKFEFGLPERSIEGSVDTARLVYCELRQRVEVLWTVTSTTEAMINRNADSNILFSSVRA